MTRQAALVRFYEILANLEIRLGGKHRLSASHGRMGWPTHGVYFFFEEGEVRQDSGRGMRVVRVGTHALRPGSSTLWKRLATHRGSAGAAGGNHRGSIFRLIVGDALLLRQGVKLDSWGVGDGATKAALRLGSTAPAIRAAEHATELAVSKTIGVMPFLWVSTNPDAFQVRAEIERGAVSLLSNVDRESLDPPSTGWLGLRSSRSLVKESGLWNNDFVDEAPSFEFLDLLEREASGMPDSRSR